VDGGGCGGVQYVELLFCNVSPTFPNLITEYLHLFWMPSSPRSSGHPTPQNGNFGISNLAMLTFHLTDAKAAR
jgi:hypothetical protein